MKKNLIITAVVFGLIGVFFFFINVMAAQTTKSTSGKATKAQLDKLAREMLKAAENRDNAALQIPFRKMAELGVESVTPPEVHAKKTPNCPPVKMELNGRTLSGKLCARMSYEYEGKIYWVGYCK